MPTRHAEKPEDRILSAVTRAIRSLAWTAPLAAAACSLSIGGPAGPPADAGPPDAREDAATGTTPSGAPCTCLDNAPMGFSYVVLDQDDQVVGCPAEYGNKRVHVEGLDPKPATCTCPNCTVTTTGSCALGTLSFRGGQTNTCADNSSTKPTQTAGCYDITNWDSPNTGTTFAGASLTGTASGDACTGGAPQVDVPVAVKFKGQTCALTGPVGTCGGAGKTCVPDVTSPFQVCVMASATAACPAGFPVAHELGDAVNDGRGCSACSTCTPTTDCTQGTMSLFSDDNCNNALGTPTVPVGANTCTSTATNNIHIHSVKVTATPMTTCVASGSTPTGTVALASPRTACCKR